jgi:phosphoenolpyruvate carboxykinase (ATP)
VEHIGINPSEYGLWNHGIKDAELVYWNLRSPSLIEIGCRRQEGHLTINGALVVRTGERTGRSPNDKFIVKRKPSEEHIAWGAVNRPFEPDRFEALFARLRAYLQYNRLFVQDCFAGADPRYRLPIRVITEYAWHSLFARNLFVRAEWGETSKHVPEFTIICAPRFHAVPQADGTNSEAFIILDFEQKLAVLGGTRYAGEMKKSVFSILNYLLPLRGVLSMHCSANVGADGDVALFFGLSGTGKTTLSADPDRGLIGDDEHGWSDTGIFNFEGGCYAKCIKLSPEYEPQIYNAIRFGAVLENVVMNPHTREPDYDADMLTENTRVAYPLNFIDNAVQPSIGGHPRNVVFLTCDAFGVLPPISKLTPDQAMYHFLSGYTAKVAGTEAGVTEPQATFSSCFGAPFLPHDPTVYAEMLGERLAKHQAACWLVNTGWSGGPYGQGQRMSLPYTRAIVKAMLSGQLSDVPTEPDPVFGLQVPQSCPGVPAEVLTPKKTWPDPNAYDAKAKELAALFNKNFEKFTKASKEIREAGPRL